MLSHLYKRHSGAILWLVALSFPVLTIMARSLPANNDIETWLPKESAVRSTYEQFKRDFGVEELILIGVEREHVSESLVEAVCGRIDRLPGIRKCWSPVRFQGMMLELGVPPEVAEERLKGLSLSENGKLIGLVALLSDAGLKDRAGTVNDIRRELNYCQLAGREVCLAGAPVVVTELDRLGGQNENQKYFVLTLIICLGLLYYWIRNWSLALAILGLTLWAINLTLAIFGLMGGEMNFILGALSVMVMVFTLEAAIHVLHYHHASRHEADPLGTALRLAWKPCCMSMLTTAIGLFSVSVTDILPVVQFGNAAALGAVVAMLTGLFITPALLVVLPGKAQLEDEPAESPGFARLAEWVLRHNKSILATSVALVAVGLFGLQHLNTKIDPLDFLPEDAQVLNDVRRVESELTTIDSIEAVVNFGESDLPFVDRLTQVRDLESRISTHPAVRHTMSLASFFPSELPENPLELLQLLNKAESRNKSRNEFLADNQRLWRISARIKPPEGMTFSEVNRDLETLTAGMPITFTGIAPLLEQAQHEIFDGFWKSFTSAFGVILVVMSLSLWSVKTAALAMIPNLAPICIVFGILGLTGIPVDIGMMMTGSIALGITVDGTFHLLVRHQEALDQGESPTQAVRTALVTTGGPIFESIVVSSIGMLALTLSSFAPTGRFGMMMATLLFAALAGGLLLLPALLTLQKRGPSARKTPTDPVLLTQEHSHHFPTPRVATDRVA